MKLSQRIKLAREYANLTQKELAEKVGISQTAVHKLECGRSRSSRRTVAIAIVCKVSPVWLETGKGDMAMSAYDSAILMRAQAEGVAEEEEEYRDGIPITQLPLIKWDAVEDWTDRPEESPAQTAKEWISVAPKITHKMYALEVQGDSMEPEFSEGDTIIVDPSTQVSNNRFVVARLPNSKQATFKQLILDGTHRFLKPLNSRYPIQDMPEAATVCGVVIGKFKSY
ncbi:MAG: LexA family transcriptional regulator [Magnetococcales bacterium]|nr:LexA family transcriptional regulator [Magnetococcales bacterium]